MEKQTKIKATLKGSILLTLKNISRMKKLTEDEMKRVLGGVYIRDCRDSLQQEAAEYDSEKHTKTEIEEFYDGWSDRWEECLRGLGLIP